jgi:hypothetical protein
MSKPSFYPRQIESRIAEEVQRSRTRFGSVLESFVYGELMKSTTTAEGEYRLMTKPCLWETIFGPPHWLRFGANSLLFPIDHPRQFVLAGIIDRGLGESLSIFAKQSNLPL